MQGLVVQPKKCGVVLEDHRAPLVLDNDIVRSGAGLLMRCGPAAISRLVVAVHIDPVKRVPCRRRPHVSNECRRIVRPSFAHRYSSPPVLRVLRIVRIEAPALGVVVGLQLSAFLTADAFPMRQRAGNNRLYLKATATSDCSASNRVQVDRLFDSAIAQEEPFGVPGRRWRALQRNESSVFFARNVEGHASHFTKQRIA